MEFLYLFLFACVGTYALTFAVRKIALRFSIVDQPDEERKAHHGTIPLLGGIALYVAFAAVVFLYYFFRPEGWHVISDAQVHGKYIAGILVGGLFLVVGGFFDDAFRLSPRTQIIWPIAAAISIIVFGIGVEALSNPFGDILNLDAYKILVLWWNGLPRYFSVIADTLTFLWLMGAMYTTKLLDGLDGLVSGITVIGMVIIAIISLFFFVNYPTAILATIAAGVFAGFLFWNFHPAKIFLGESGSTFAGYLLGVFAIISGAKFATLLLILGIPILDVAWVLARRMFIERRSPFLGDRKHLHFRLLDSGFSHRVSVLILYFFAASFGILALFLQSRQKIVSLIILLCIMIAGSILLVRRQQKFLAKQ